MRYAFIEEQRTQHCVRRMCNLLKVSPAGYYEWRGRPPSSRALADVDIRSAIVRVHAESRRTYGRPRIHAKLQAEGRHLGAKRVRRLMKAAGVAGIWPRRFRKTTDSNHGLPVAKNILARAFDVKQIAQTNQVWAGDITYVPTREGWLYLAVVLDLVSRRVIGWSMDSTMDRKSSSRRYVRPSLIAGRSEERFFIQTGAANMQARNSPKFSLCMVSLRV